MAMKSTRPLNAFRHWELTPAAERALRAAATWHFPEQNGVGPHEILIGLLAEEECRAADWLRQSGIHESRQLTARWPHLRQHVEGPLRELPEPHPSFLSNLRAAIRRVSETGRPPELATEHLLLALAIGEGEVTQWLHGQGLTAEAVATRIRDLHGVQADNTPVSLPEEPVVQGTLPLPPKGCGTVDENTASPLPALSSEILAEKAEVWRILDAAANRAMEALRVVEDYARFILDDVLSTACCKEMRHELGAILRGWGSRQRLLHRRTEGSDVGSALHTEAELTRQTTAEVCHVNLKRCQESLRSLEEYSKLHSADDALSLKSLRYRTYTLEQALLLGSPLRQRLERARLYVLVDCRESVQAFSDLIAGFVEVGVHVLQLRDKNASDRLLLERAEILRELTAGSQTLAIINDRADITLLSGADGLHVGQSELSAQQARRCLPARHLLGVSTHSKNQAQRAEKEGADYIGVGPIFRSNTKNFDKLAGVALLREIVGEVRIPAFAIGGVTRRKLPEVLKAGFSRVAVCGALLDTSNPSAEAEKWLEDLSTA